MKFCTLTILVVLFCVSVALSKSRGSGSFLRGLRSLFERGSRQHEKRDYRGRGPLDQCQLALKQCTSNAKQYMNTGIDAVFADLRQNGIGEACNVVKDILLCQDNALDSDVCSDSPAKQIIAGVGASYLSTNYDFLCNQKADEIEANGECLFDVEIYHDVHSCMYRARTSAGRTHQQLDVCDEREALKLCIEEVTDKSDHCSSEGKSLYVEIMWKTYGRPGFENCSGP